MAGRVDYFDDPGAPRANSLVPSVCVVVVDGAGQILLIRRADDLLQGGRPLSLRPAATWQVRPRRWWRRFHTGSHRSSTGEWHGVPHETIAPVLAGYLLAES